MNLYRRDVAAPAAPFTVAVAELLRRRDDAVTRDSNVIARRRPAPRPTARSDIEVSYWLALRYVELAFISEPLNHRVELISPTRVDDRRGRPAGLRRWVFVEARPESERLVATLCSFPMVRF